MKSNYRVVVIGGGVVGASVLYHLTKKGWRDVVLLERLELTSGSTWHAAGGMHTINGDPNVAKLQPYSINLYKEIEEISGQSVGLHMTEGLMLAATPARYEWLKNIHSKGRYMGMQTELVSLDEAQRLLPLLGRQKAVRRHHVRPYPGPPQRKLLPTSPVGRHDGVGLLPTESPPTQQR